MPIRRQFKYLYPIDWPQISVMIRFNRAKGRCECCDRPHGHTVQHLGDGRWWDDQRLVWRDGRGRDLPRVKLAADDPSARPTKVVLAAAHIDHDPSNCKPRNLKAFCQRCHLLHDREEHQRRRWLTLRMRKAVGDLFLGSYPLQ